MFFSTLKLAFTDSMEHHYTALLSWPTYIDGHS